jgi:hypothetical protein
MKKLFLFLTITAFTAACGALLAQTPQSAGIVYQQAGVIGVQSVAGGPGPTALLAMAPGLMGSPDTVTGSPLSATNESHSLQVLSDGTRIERNESQQVYRDSMGRTRVESEPTGSGTVMIQDPVSGVMVLLDPVAKTAQKMPAPPQKIPKPGRTEARFSISDGAGLSVATGGGGSVDIGRGMVIARAAAPLGAASSAAKPVTENLPAQSVNGVTATGSRTTLTISAGQIGNDRPIQVVSETWYSSDLQMMVKSSNSDPRFGDTSFELTNIIRSEPDPGLFQIPADYTVSEGKSPVVTRFRTEQPKE